MNGLLLNTSHTPKQSNGSIDRTPKSQSTFDSREFNLEVQQNVVRCFAPAGRDVYSSVFSILFGAPEERNVLVWFATHQMFRS
jgi:hypothetical protein